MMMQRKQATLGRAVETYLAELHILGRSAKTVELQGYLLEKLVKTFGPSQAIRSITREQIVEHLGHLATTGLSKSTICCNGKVIKCFFGWLVRQGYIKANPLATLSVGQMKCGRVFPFSPDECERLLAAADTPLKRLAVLLLLDCGLRASELASLKLADVDLAAGVIHVRRAKGGKTRRLALNDGPREALLAYLASRDQRDGLLWPEGWTRKVLGGMLVTLGSHAGVPNVHPHRFRYTWGCRFLLAGGGELALKTLAGWSSWAMVEHYVEAVAAESALDVHRQHPMAGCRPQTPQESPHAAILTAPIHGT